MEDRRPFGGLEKKVLESILRHHREPSKKLASFATKECLPASPSDTLVAVWKTTKKGK